MSRENQEIRLKWGKRSETIKETTDSMTSRIKKSQ